MTPQLRIHFDQALSEARTLIAQGELEGAWPALERAHILSQAHAWPHTLVHGEMLRLGLRQRSISEVVGQLFRLLLAAPGSWSGRAPLGNIGRATVGAFTPMPLPDDLRALFDRES